MPIIGLAGEESLDQGRELLECPIHHPKLNALITALPEFIREFQLHPYRISERKGELKGLIAFYSPDSNEMYLRFILRSQECVSRIRKLLPKLVSKFPALVVVTANIQPIPHAILEGPEEIFITERREIHHRIGGHEFRLSPGAFVQTNSEVAARLYATAADWIRDSGGGRVCELFCGQGAFSFFAAKHAKQLLGVDINADGVRAANDTAREQGFTHLSFQTADASRVSDVLETFRPDLLLVNPPRRGLGAAVDFLVPPKSVIYSSCSLESLVEDLRKISGHYRIAKAQIFDMFPHTEHFEILTLLVPVEA